jgi:type IV secretory pathway VirJ component
MATKRFRSLLAFVAIIVVTLVVTLIIGGYFESAALRVQAPRRGRAVPALGAVYWSGDMGMRVGVGNGVVTALLEAGIPVVSVSSPALFWKSRNQAFADRAVADSMRQALVRTGASRIVLVGNSFGADILGVTVGHLSPDLRRRIASVILIAPGTDVYFHANPTGIFYRGPGDADPEHTIPLLRGLPVTCISGSAESDSLCRSPLMSRAARISIGGGHLMLGHHDELDGVVAHTALNPPGDMR